MIQKIVGNLPTIWKDKIFNNLLKILLPNVLCLCLMTCGNVSKIVNTPEITEKTSEITEKTSEITEKTSEITEKTSEITEKTSEITEKTSEITEKILSEIQKNPQISNQELSVRIGRSADSIFYYIKKLKTQGVLRRIGPDKGGHWEIIKSSTTC